MARRWRAEEVSVVVKVPDLYPSEPLPVRLMNTIWADRDGVHDALETPAHLQQWAEQCGLAPDRPVSARDLSQARLLRDALRRLTAAAVRDERSHAVDAHATVEASLAALNSFTTTCVPELRAEGHAEFERGWRSSAKGFERQLVDVALEGADLLSEEPTVRLGACHGPGCVLYFFRAPARREWCSAGCGNRARVARHYHRHKR